MTAFQTRLPHRRTDRSPPASEPSLPAPKGAGAARRRYAAVLAVALLAALAWHGNQRVPAPPASGNRLHSAAAGSSLSPHRTPNTEHRKPYSAQVSAHVPVPLQAAERLRVATFNIHGGKGLDGQRDLDRTARCLEGCQLVGLNELHAARLPLSTDQAETLGRSLQLDWLFVPTVRRWWRDNYGNGLLSDVPIEHWQRIPLSGGGDDSHRAALLVRVPWGERTLNVLMTHVVHGDNGDNAGQLATVAELYRALAEPSILLGDLNADRDHPIIAALLAEPGVRDPVREQLGQADPRRIDWIITRGLESHAAGVINSEASDHPLVWAELSLDAE